MRSVQNDSSTHSHLWPARLAADQSGSVTIIYGLVSAVMLLMIGAAIDVGQLVAIQRQTKSAVDAAVLAGARVLESQAASQDAATQAATTAAAFYDANMSARKALTDAKVAFTAMDNNTAFSGTVTAKFESKILQIGKVLGLTVGDTYNVSVKSEAAIKRLSNLEVSIMLDTSGSMDGDKLVQLKDAAKDLVDRIVRDDQSHHTSRVALAPFSAEVRVPASWNAAVTGDAADRIAGEPSCTMVYPGRGSRRGEGRMVCTDTVLLKSACVVERHGGENFSDAAPGPGQNVTARYTADGSCYQPSENEVVALSADKKQLKARIDGLKISNSTAGHLGTAWAWYTLSPEWAPVFPSAAQPAKYSANTKKIAILMTDGEFNAQYKTNGTSGTSPNGRSTDQALALCANMKAKGITVYTVGFDLGGNQTAITTLSRCASSVQNFYNANDGRELKLSFRDIARKQSSLHLRK